MRQSRPPLLLLRFCLQHCLLPELLLMAPPRSCAAAHERPARRRPVNAADALPRDSSQSRLRAAGGNFARRGRIRERLCYLAHAMASLGYTTVVMGHAESGLAALRSRRASRRNHGRDHGAGRRPQCRTGAAARRGRCARSGLTADAARRFACCSVTPWALKQ